MDINIKKIGIITGAILLIMSSGCGSSSDSSSDSSASGGTVRGIVSDPEIEGATVTFERAGKRIYFYNSSNKLSYYETTDATGAFSARFRSGEDLSNVTMKASGGVDTESKDNLEGIELTSPLDAFSSKSNAVISPLTTLVVEQMKAGEGLESARKIAKENLGLDTTADLTLNPSATGNEELLQRSFIITRIIKQMRDESADLKEPFKRLSSKLEDHELLATDGSLNNNLLSNVITKADNRAKLADTYKTVKEPGSVKEKMERIIIYDFAKAIQNTYITDTGYTGDISDDRLQRFKDLAKVTLKKLNQKVPETNRADMIRLLVNDFNIRTDADYMAAGLVDKVKTADATFDGLNIKLNNFIKKDLFYSNRYTTKYKAEVPLTSGELLGTDNSKRIEYYYNSDISNFYDAERTLKDVRDDDVNDYIYSKIVGGKAEHGLFNEAKRIIDQKMWITKRKSDSHRYIAKAYSSFNKRAEAKRELAKAEAGYKKIISAGGNSSITDNIENLRNLSFAYGDAKANQELKNLLDYIEGFKADYGAASKWLLISKLFSGNHSADVSGLAELYLNQAITARKANNNAKAKELLAKAVIYVDKSQNIVSQFPADERSGKQFYQRKTFQLSDNMQFYAEIAREYKILGDKVEEAKLKTKALNVYENDGEHDIASSLAFGTTANQASVQTYMVTVARALAMINEVEKAKAVAGSISSKYQKMPAYSYIAAEMAINASGDASADAAWEAFAQIDSTTDRIKYGTYSQTLASPIPNQGYFLAQVVYSDLDTATKAKHLDRGLALVDSYKSQAASDNDKYTYLVQKGYTNIADLYRMIGSTAKAKDVMLKAADIVENEISDETKKRYGLKELCVVYNLLKDQTKVDNYSQQVALLIDSKYSSDPKNKAANYASYLSLSKYYSPSRSIAEAFISKQLTAAREILTNSETNKKNKVNELVKAAKAYIKYAKYTKASSALDEAYSIAKAISKPSDKSSKIEDVIEEFANAKEFDKAKKIADSISEQSDKYDALKLIAHTYSKLDTFPDTTVASVDTDKDGKPDFFNPLATRAEIIASGLTLDEDIDNDGINDDKDKYPYDKSRN